MKSVEIKKIDAIAAILFFIGMASIVAFSIGILTKNHISALLGAILYYSIIIYLLVMGWKGGFENGHRNT